MTTPALTAWLPGRESPMTQGLLLGTFTLLVCLLVGGCWWITTASIDLRTREDTQNLLAQVMPADNYDNVLTDNEVTLELDGQPRHFFRASLHGQPSGIVLFSTTQGYGGPIELLTGIDANGNITGVRVINHKETPGLGDNIELSHTPWILAFNGKSLSNTTQSQWHVKKDGGEFDQFTGATITPRAVVRGIHEDLQLFAEHRQAMLGTNQEKKP
jgi:electron transport complex protein RnfG